MHQTIGRQKSVIEDMSDTLTYHADLALQALFRFASNRIVSDVLLDIAGVQPLVACFLQVLCTFLHTFPYFAYMLLQPPLVPGMVA